MNKTSIFSLILMLLSIAVSANEKQTVKQVSTAVELTTDVDYIITSAEPFTDEGSVNIVNTDHAVLILESIKPSAALSLLSHITIDDAKAVNNSTCQVKIYNQGCIIMPYAKSIRPLTVYTEENFTGESANSFGLENSGGFMNTLTNATLNNRIRSFKLKRGYMVTFSTLPKGRGYSRCFIAADSDLEIAQLPAVLSDHISSYRIFRWNDTSKSGLANDTRAAVNNILNTTSCYSFGLGEDGGMDRECVPHHIHEGWPAIADCGRVTYSPHMKTNNEPRNTSDDHPDDLNAILNNWEELMATGMRLCSPSSWDGSDYVSNASGFLRQFFDSIDARGWRCDIIDLHCYWAEGTFNQIVNWVNAVHRPVWISEWVWGASWNNNGIFGEAKGTNRDNPTFSQLNSNKLTLSRILTNLNKWDYIERYFYWNSEANCSKLYYNDALTPAGEYYSKMNTGLGYNSKYDYVPTTPRQYPPSNFNITTEEGVTTLTWQDRNGEYNQLMEVQRKQQGGQWQTVAVIDQKETASTYTWKDEAPVADAKYRIHIINLEGTDLYTDDTLEAGDYMTTPDGHGFYLGGNVLLNGDFVLGTQGWTAGNGQPIDKPYFQAVPVGGPDGGSYLQAYGNAGMDKEGSLLTSVDIKPHQDYLFSVYTRNGGAYMKVDISTPDTQHPTPDTQTESETIATLRNTSEWEKQSFTFNSGSASQALIAFRWLGAKAQFAKFEVRQLFGTHEEAIADGAVTEAPRNEALAQLQETLQQQRLDSLNAVEAVLQSVGCPIPVSDLSFISAPVQPQSPNFQSATGWKTKDGTYKDGDQRTNTVQGKSCWNAWWSGISAAEGKRKTMQVSQKVSSLPEGLYVMECKATTEHFCISDQHGYLVLGSDTVNTPVLQADYFDLPTVGNIWQTLTTTPVFIPEGSSVTIGFTSSKQGATDNAWHKFGDGNNTGDKREGWWCATDFVLRYIPTYTLTPAEGPWGTICLPNAITTVDGLTLYQIAGLTPDSTQVCIEPVANPVAGVPYIYRTDSPTLRLFLNGEAVTSAQRGENNLYGFFTASVKVPADGYVLHNGEWYVVKERPRAEHYSACIRKLDGMTILPDWNGLTMPLHQTSWEEVTAIQYPSPDTHHPTPDTQHPSDGIYTLQGHKLSPNTQHLSPNTHHPKGIYLRKIDGKVKKTIMK